jgi:DNA-binding MarR family transcriptional regulator
LDRSGEVSELEAHYGYWLRLVSNHVSHSFRTRVEARGVTVAEWVLLRELLASGPTAPSQAADRLGMTRGAISKLVDRTCAKGLVQRTAEGQDRRYQQVALTPAGAELVPELARLADENDREFFGPLSDEERALLMDVLQGMARRSGWKNAPTE